MNEKDIMNLLFYAAACVCVCVRERERERERERISELLEVTTMSYRTRIRQVNENL